MGYLWSTKSLTSNSHVLNKIICVAHQRMLFSSRLMLVLDLLPSRVLLVVLTCCIILEQIEKKLINKINNKRNFPVYKQQSTKPHFLEVGAE